MFLACTVVTIAGMLGLSVVMTRMTGLPAVRSMIIALVFLTIVTASVLGLVVVMTRT